MNDTNQTILLANVMVCTKCGSVIDYPIGIDGMHTCSWCPACSPGSPWRRGHVVAESWQAKAIRKQEAEATSSAPPSAAVADGEDFLVVMRRIVDEVFASIKQRDAK